MFLNYHAGHDNLSVTPCSIPDAFLCVDIGDFAELFQEGVTCTMPFHSMRYELLQVLEDGEHWKGSSVTVSTLEHLHDFARRQLED